MNPVEEKKKAKRPSKGKPKQIRRLKQETHKADVLEADLKKLIRQQYPEVKRSLELFLWACSLGFPALNLGRSPAYEMSRVPAD